MAYLYLMRQRKAKVSNMPVLLCDLRDDEIYQSTRFSRLAVEKLCLKLGNELRHPTARSHAIPVDTQVLAALQFYASGSFQWVVGRSCGLSQSSVSLAIEQVTSALVRLAPEYIRFPTDQHSLSTNKTRFHAVCGFPNIIGAIDCTHVAIKSPSTNEDAYVNRCVFN